MENKYTKEQVEDIRSREKEGLEALKKLNLTPACQIVKENLGNDVFGDRLYPYLADTKYAGGQAGIESPYIENDPNKKA